MLLELAAQLVTVAVLVGGTLFAVQKIADVSEDPSHPGVSDAPFHALSAAEAETYSRADALSLSDKPIYKMAVSPEAGTVVVCGLRKFGEVRDLKSGTVLRLLELPGQGITAVTQSVDGRFVLAGGENGLLGLWDTQGKPAAPRTWPGHQSEVTAALFSPDGRWFASGDSAGVVCVWDSAGGALIKRLTAPASGAISDLKVPPDGRHLAAARFTGRLQVWETSSWRPAWESQTASVAVRGAAFSPDGETLLTCGFDHVLRLWDVRSGEELWSTKTKSFSTCAAFASSGAHFVAGDDCGTFSVWDADTRSRRESWKQLHRGTISGLQFSANGDHFFSAGYDGAFETWNCPLP